MTSKVALVIRARELLGWSQKTLGENLGYSRRTAARWEAGRSTMFGQELTLLARHVYPLDRALAAELVSCAGLSLESAGIEEPAPPPEPPPSPPPPPLRELVESIVCAVADLAEAVPHTVRPLVLLTLRRAVEVKLDLDAASKQKLFQDDAPVPARATTPRGRSSDIKAEAPSK